MGYVKRKCLVCSHEDRTEESKEDYQEVKVCPECNGAWVDLWKISMYMDAGIKPEGAKVPLLKIELDDIHSPPAIWYNGKRTKGIVTLNLNYETSNEEPGSGSNEFEFKHAIVGDGKVEVKTVGCKRIH